MAPKKKDFSAVNVNPVYSAIAEATEQLPGQLAINNDSEIVEEQPAAVAQEVLEEQPKQRKARKTYNATEAEELKETLNTTGRKGVKLPRINMAFTPANYEFLKIMAQVRGQTITEFLNDIIKEARTEHADIYEKAIEFRNSL